MAALVAQAASEIQAPIALVWAILIDLAAYPEWNPFIVEVTGICPPAPEHPIAVNTEFTLHCEYSDGTTSTSREKVTQVTPPGESPGGRARRAVLAYRFAGPAAALGVVNSTRFQWLEQGAGGGATRYRTEERFTGPGAALVPLAQVQDGFERMAVALKVRAESMT